MFHPIIPPLKIIGVTGTNGKTSISHFIAQALKKAGFNTGIIGTLGNGLTDHLEPSRLTTPGPEEYQKLLAYFKSKNTDIITLEASSHGLAQNRLKNTDFYITIFTNLTQDHLDYHKSLENYEAAKLTLFTDYNTQHSIINIDDPTGFKFAELLKNKCNFKNIYCTSTELQKNPLALPLIYTKNITPHHSGTTAEIYTPWGNGVLNTKLYGKFNISNLLAVITTLGIFNINLTDSLTYISQLNGVTGRMQLFNPPENKIQKNKPAVIIDYAHTPDALEKTLITIQEHCTGKIWCVFGCGGDRDKTKRPQMAHIAESLSDYLIITDDNPRTEKSLHIIADIKSGLKNIKPVIIEQDRRLAIQHAISSAKPEDIVLIAGKGHETYQEIGHERLPFSDELEVKLLLA